MMTVKQLSSLTGVSVRTLQYYDEIGLFKPAKVTEAGYRLYDENSLEVLQQILFFRELDFKLKEIAAIMGNPQFDREAAYLKQQELIRLKRDRLDNLLGLLDRLLRGENCMEFQDFDMSEYVRMLEDFKKTHTDEIIRRFGSMEQFEKMVSELSSHEEEIAGMAADMFGSVEQYKEAMRKNFQAFLTKGPTIDKSEVESLTARTEELTKQLTACLGKDPASPEVLAATSALLSFCDICNRGIEVGENYWSGMAELYLTNPVYQEVNDRKYGEGASTFIGLAIKEYLKKQS